MNEARTISKESTGLYGKEYAFLRQEGLNHIEKLSGRLWSDYNTHDPGVTILEMLCYAITDLGYRIAMPVEDILAQPKDNIEQMHRQFRSAMKALPSAPLNAGDYRQLFVRVEGVRNAWMAPFERKVVANYLNPARPGEADLHYKLSGETVEAERALEFGLQGLNEICLDYDEGVLMDGVEMIQNKQEQLTLIAKRKEAIVRRVLEIYHRYRNLCEDVETVREVPKEGVVICGDIDLEASADPEQVWARIVFAIGQYLSPDLPFYSLQEMLDMGKTTDEIFEGPVFGLDDGYLYATAGNPFTKKGFICREDMDNSVLRTEVRLSDIIRIIMETEGVSLIRDITFGLCDCAEKSSDAVRKAVAGDRWNLCITPGAKPVFCQESSVLNFRKEMVPIELKKEEARQALSLLWSERNTRMSSRLTEDLPMPDGRYRQPGEYATMQNDFPDTFGIGHTGVAPSATTSRKAQAKQLKAYLLFFDQVLANYFAQLGSVGDLFSTDHSISKSYFANVVKGLAGAEEIFDGAENWETVIESVLRDKGLDPFISRRNRFLDHLLARFAEHFNDYAFMMHRLYEGDADRAIIRNKIDFLNDYDNMSISRGLGFDCFNPCTPSQRLVNIPGMEKRISRLLGFNHYRRLPLSALSYSVGQTGVVPGIGDPTVKQPCYGWSIRRNGVSVLESLNRSFTNRSDAYEELGLASILACEPQYYVPVPDAKGRKVSFRLCDTRGNAIASHPLRYDMLAGEPENGHFSLLEKAVSELVSYFLNEFRLEGMYVVEHLLLRPEFDQAAAAGSKGFIPVCIAADGSYSPPLDPYSFRVTVVLPGYGMRLRNKHFRRFAERIIRMETPAHVLPRICFVNEENMKRFEEAFGTWLNERCGLKEPMTGVSSATLGNLIAVLSELFTVYEEGSLSDCDDDTVEKNPVVLGISRLGSLESDSKPD
ncbi:MAG: hypothetical protein HGA97_00800 [Chlorobiaceae bacterium]|nr:hypothetical protein [Chlorobiaceae bacterium]